MTPPAKSSTPARPAAARSRRSARRPRDVDRVHWIRDPETIEALVSPVRQNLVDRLEALGPCSVRELAESLRVAPDSLYYHIKLLVEAGVLVATGSRGTTRRDETLYDVARRNWHVRYEPDEPENARAVRRLAASILRQAERDFEAGLQDPAATVSGPRRNLWSLRLEAPLTDDELERVNDHLAAILEILRKPQREGAEGTLCAMSWLLAPIERTRGRRRPARPDDA